MPLGFVPGFLCSLVPLGWGALSWVQPCSSVMCQGQFWCDTFHSAAAGTIPCHQLGFCALSLLQFWECLWRMREVV